MKTEQWRPASCCGLGSVLARQLEGEGTSQRRGRRGRGGAAAWMGCKGRSLGGRDKLKWVGCSCWGAEGGGWGEEEGDDRGEEVGDWNGKCESEAAGVRRRAGSADGSCFRFVIDTRQEKTPGTDGTTVSNVTLLCLGMRTI